MKNIALYLFCFLSPLILAPVRAKYLNVTVDNTDPSIQYVGNWNQCVVNPSTSYNGTRNCTTQKGATATFTFTGVAIYYIAPGLPGDATMIVLDSESPVSVDLTPAAGESSDWAVKWKASGLSNGSHTLVNYGLPNTATYGEVDAFIYTVFEQDYNNTMPNNTMPNNTLPNNTMPNNTLPNSTMPVVEQDHKNHIAATAGGAVSGVAALALVGACCIFHQTLADWLRELAFFMFGWFFFKGRYFAFSSDVPDETQITLFLTLTPCLPGSASQAQSSGGVDEVLCWKVLHIGPGRRQEVVHLPSRGRKGDPCLVFCTLNETRNGFESNAISDGAASDYVQNEDGYILAPSDRPGISIRNQAPDVERFGLATPFEKGIADPFWTFIVPKNESRDFTANIYVHAFRTAGVMAGSKYNFSDVDFLANRITEENGCEVSKLGPTTYWYVYQSGEGLRVKIGKSLRAIKRYKHRLQIP